MAMIRALKNYFAAAPFLAASMNRWISDFSNIIRRPSRIHVIRPSRTSFLSVQWLRPVMRETSSIFSSGSSVSTFLDSIALSGVIVAADIVASSVFRLVVIGTNYVDNPSVAGGMRQGPSGFFGGSLMIAARVPLPRAPSGTARSGIPPRLEYENERFI